MRRVANFNLALPFWRSCQRHPSRPAIVGESTLTYAEGADAAGRVAAWLVQAKARRVVVLASRSTEAYLGGLACAWAGVTFVPLSLKLPEERLVAILRQANPDAILHDAGGARMLTEAVLRASPARVFNLEQRPDAQSIPPVEVQADHSAHIIFTSGTTGVSKGVVVAAASVKYLIDTIQKRWSLTEHDRLTAGFELSFDAAVFDMFLAWNAGACLCVVPPEQAMAPARFLHKHEITVSHFAASVLAFMGAIKALTPGAFPLIRHSLFGAEAVPLSGVQAWQLAAPNATIETTYGPTEGTIFCLLHTLTDPPVFTPERGLMALGEPIGAEVKAAVVDEDLNFLPAGQTGELALGGVPVAQGYLDHPALTASRFPTVKGERWYLTGDRAYQDSNGIFHHMGRTDNQVKIMGHRLELEEIESYLRTVSETESVAVVVCATRGTPGLVGFVGSQNHRPEEIRSRLLDKLPSYSVPSRILCLEHMPLNANGKIDRMALLASLE